MSSKSEPLTFEELKSRNINRSTLIWFEGLSDWIKAGLVDELEDLFNTVPPAIKKEIPPPLHAIEPDNELSQTFMSRNGSKVMWAALAIAIVFFLVYSFGNKNASEAAIQTRENTESIKQQQQQLDTQNAKIAEQEQIEKERLERERKETIQKRLDALSQKLIVSQQNLEEAKRQLNDATSFQFIAVKRRAE